MENPNSNCGKQQSHTSLIGGDPIISRAGLSVSSYTTNNNAMWKQPTRKSESDIGGFTNDKRTSKKVIPRCS